jgi:hypothetical protein
MTSPRVLLFSIAATLCSFLFALVTIASQASSSATPIVGATQASSSGAVVAQEISHDAPVAWTVAWVPAASR